MSITSLKHLFQLQKKETGYVMTYSSPCKAGGTLPIYIPRLMPKIDNGEPTVSVVSSKGRSVFKNDASCMPAPYDVLETQNYINPRFENNKMWTPNLLVAGLVPRKTKVDCNCHSNSISTMTFSNDLS